MKTVMRIGTLFREDLGEQLFNELIDICPEGLGGAEDHSFWVELPMNDPRGSAVMNALDRAGYRRSSDLPSDVDTMREYGLEYLRVYETVDFASADLLELRPPTESHLFDSPREKDGMIRLLQGHLNDAIDIGFTMTSWFVVPDRVKRLLQHSDLIGVKFKPTLLLPGTDSDASSRPVPWDSYGDPWWELDSDLTMPPLSDSMMFTDSEGNVIKVRDFSNGFHRLEGLYMYPELHYRESAVAKLPPWDLARTFEAFGNRKEYDRSDCPLVVSKRFYEFFVGQGLKTGWLPVHIDPD